MAKTLEQELLGLALEETYGPYEVYADDDRAVIINTDRHKVVKRFRGESAWSNANRYASDLYWEARNNS